MDTDVGSDLMVLGSAKIEFLGIALLIVCVAMFVLSRF